MASSYKIYRLDKFGERDDTSEADDLRDTRYKIKSMLPLNSDEEYIGVYCLNKHHTVDSVMSIIKSLLDVDEGIDAPLRGSRYPWMPCIFGFADSDDTLYIAVEALPRSLHKLFPSKTRPLSLRIPLPSEDSISICRASPNSYLMSFDDYVTVIKCPCIESVHLEILLCNKLA